MLDKIEVNKIKLFEKNWLNFIKTNHSEILEEIKDKKILSKEIDTKLNKLAINFIKNFLN